MWALTKMQQMIIEGRLVAQAIQRVCHGMEENVGFGKDAADDN